MKTLYLARHGKSSWRDTELRDIDRPLKEKGVKDAYKIASVLLEKSIHPDHIITSPAIRAMHTAIIFSRVLDFEPMRIEINPFMYGIDKEGLINLVEGLNPQFDSVMIFGHDPVLTNFVNYLVNENYEKIPTSGVACITSDVSEWSQVKPENSVLKFLEHPKKTG